jgi:hypothetical protein
MSVKASNLFFPLYLPQYHSSFLEFSLMPLNARLKIRHPNHQSFGLKVE